MSSSVSIFILISPDSFIHLLHPFDASLSSTLFQMIEDLFSGSGPDESVSSSELTSVLMSELGSGFSSGFSSDSGLGSGSGLGFESAWGSGEVYSSGFLHKAGNNKRRNYSQKPEH